MSRKLFGSRPPRAERLCVMVEVGRGHKQKLFPDARDRAIFMLLNDGLKVSEIAKHFGHADSSIEKRIHWCKAKRWATFDGRLLTAEERDRVIERERELFRKGVA